MNKQMISRAPLAIEYRRTETLIPYAQNARKHPRSQIKALARSLENYGWTNPIIIAPDNTVVCGHGRLEAAKLLGMASVPTIAVSTMSPEDIRAYILADNALAEQSGFDKAIAGSELKALADMGYDVELTGFSTLQIDTMINIGDPDPAGEKPVELPAEAGPFISRVGDLWVCGPHRIACGDARLTEVYLKLMAGMLAQMIFTDPVYNVKVQGNVSGLGKANHGEFVMGSGELSDSEFENVLLRPVFKNIRRFSIAGTIALICMDWRGGRILQDAADGVFAKLKNLIVWAKTNAGMGTFYRSQHELIFAYKVSEGEHINNFGLGGQGRHRSNVWTYAGANTFRKGRDTDLADHPTVKPVQLVADAILDCSKPGGIILNPFLGSGTTIVAAHKVGRIGYGIELDPRYCDVALRRIVEAVGQPAMLDGKTFDEVAAERAGEVIDV